MDKIFRGQKSKELWADISKVIAKYRSSVDCGQYDISDAILAIAQSVQKLEDKYDKEIGAIKRRLTYKRDI